MLRLHEMLHLEYFPPSTTVHELDKVRVMAEVAGLKVRFTDYRKRDMNIVVSGEDEVVTQWVEFCKELRRKIGRRAAANARRQDRAKAARK